MDDDLWLLPAGQTEFVHTAFRDQNMVLGYRVQVAIDTVDTISIQEASTGSSLAVRVPGHVGRCLQSS